MPTRMIGSRSVDRIRAAVKSTANAVHMSAPAEEHHPSKKTLQQGSHPHMPLCLWPLPADTHATYGSKAEIALRVLVRL